jgi:predicted ATP-grasp superfamily ATP-dependent carboligase
MLEKRTNSADPSLLRDIASGTTAEERFDRLVAHFAVLSAEFHTFKGDLAANTLITKKVADNQVVIEASLGRIDFTMLADFLEAVGSMKGGIKVLGWLERPAKWFVAVAAAVTLAYSFWNKP